MSNRALYSFIIFFDKNLYVVLAKLVLQTAYMCVWQRKMGNSGSCCGRRIARESQSLANKSRNRSMSRTSKDRISMLGEVFIGPLQSSNANCKPETAKSIFVVPEVSQISVDISSIRTETPKATSHGTTNMDMKYPPLASPSFNKDDSPIVSPVAMCGQASPDSAMDAHLCLDM